MMTHRQKSFLHSSRLSVLRSAPCVSMGHTKVRTVILTSVNWNSFPSDLRNTLTVHVLPFIRSLETNEVTQMPLLELLCNCPRLLHIHLSANLGLIPSNSVTGRSRILVGTLPVVRTVSFGVFGVEDFHETKAVARYLQMKNPPKYLHLEKYFGVESFRLYLSFLRPFRAP
ncbi:hypothetical protein DL96DRAFT_1009344 [Flagelloscypha sp. PMI_526]|nr:hypothetical protein DL96DRAFT_1009344 [Flagelloscypha sp. PMI_526]